MTDWKGKAKLGRHTIREFRFADGRRLDVTLAYRTVGTLDADAGNAVLLLHGTAGSGLQFLQPSTADFLFESGQPLDAGRFFVILPDAIGAGLSSRPSDRLGPDFPRYGYGDIVEAQRRLLAEGLGVGRLRLLLGTSMGGMQTWMWGERHPDAARALMPIASLPERITGRNLLWRRMLIDLIESDPGYAAGHYDQQPAGLGHALALAPLPAVNFEDDELNPVELGGLARAIPKVPRGQAVTLPAGPKSRGHETIQLAEIWSGRLARLLAQTETAPA